MQIIHKLFGKGFVCVKNFVIVRKIKLNIKNVIEILTLAKIPPGKADDLCNRFWTCSFVYIVSSLKARKGLQRVTLSRLLP